MKSIRIPYRFHQGFTWFEALPYRSFSPMRYSPDIFFFPTSLPIVEVGFETLAFFKRSQLDLKIRPTRDPSVKTVI